MCLDLVAFFRLLVAVPTKDPDAYPAVINGLVEVCLKHFNFLQFGRFCQMAGLLMANVYKRETQPIFCPEMWVHFRDCQGVPDLTADEKSALIWLKGWRSGTADDKLRVLGNCGAPGCLCSFSRGSQK